MIYCIMCDTFATRSPWRMERHIQDHIDHDLYAMLDALIASTVTIGVVTALVMRNHDD